MAMLAERKRKQKWTLNPRGKDWSEDSNKFGQKLLEKMGWKHGKGLGLNEDGIVDNVKVSYKNDSRGMGFNEQSEQWTEHQENFTKLLENLKQDNHSSAPKDKIQSLEEKSLKSRARVHYHKFTRGKDLSRYSAKDLANILGKKTLKEPVVKEVPLQATENDQPEESKSFGVEVIHGGSMSDYFKKKLPNFSMKTNYRIGSNGVLKAPDNSDSEAERPSFGMGFTPFNYDAHVNETELKSNNEVQQKIKKEKSEKSIQDTFVSFIKKENEDSNISLNADVLNTNTEKKSKKKRNKSKNGSKDSVNEKENNFISYLEQPDVENEAEEKVSENNKGKKRKSCTTDDVIVNEETQKKIKGDPENEETEPKKKKSKKKNKDKEIGISNPAFDLMVNNLESKVDSSKMDDTPQIAETKKRKSKKRNKDNELGNPAFNLQVEDTAVEETNSPSPDSTIEHTPKKRKLEPQIEAAQTKKKKSKNKNKLTELGISNPAFDPLAKVCTIEKHVLQPIEEVEANDNNSKTEEDLTDASNKQTEEVLGSTVKTKTKKKNKTRKLNGFTNPDFEIQEETNSDIVAEENPYEIKVKQKKRKEYTENSFAVDNPNFDPHSSIQSSQPTENYEVVRKEKKKKKKREAVTITNSTPNETTDIECDIMLNVQATPVTPKVQSILSESTPSSKISLKRRKSVRFSDVNHERIIPNNEDIEQMNTDYNRIDLYEINTKVIENSLEEQARKEGKIGLVNPGFDLRSVDAISFYERPSSKQGLINTAFNENSIIIQENLIGISKNVENYQAEIENDINEAKDISSKQQKEAEEVPLGSVGSRAIEHKKTDDGVLLAFQNASFDKDPQWRQKAAGAKKAYKHLIQGDVELLFKDCNLHTINGYGNFKVKTK